MNLTRRQMLAASAAAVPALASFADESKKADSDGRKRMGVVIHSYGGGRFRDPLTFLEHCHKIGAGGIQTSIGARDKEYTAKLRDRVEATGMYLEGSIRLPQERKDVERFAAEVRTAKEAGATVLRSAILGGRRYETFDTAAAFREFADRAYQSLGLAEPVVSKANVRLAVENHKDWRVPDLVDMLKRLSSAHVGVCVDTGNSIALLEEPMEVVEAYAPWAYSVHFKDMAVQEYADGFLLSEVPFGTGYLDLKKIVQVLRKARPEVRFSLEMITRDPLKVPCLTKRYWATFENLPGWHLAQTLAMVRKHAAKQALPRVTGLTADKRLEAEEDNVRRCLAYAREHLDL